MSKDETCSRPLIIGLQNGKKGEISIRDARHRKSARRISSFSGTQVGNYTHRPLEFTKSRGGTQGKRNQHIVVWHSFKSTKPELGIRNP